MTRTPQGHTAAHSGKRVQVVLFTGASFVAKLKRKEGAYHEFFDHDKVRSDKIQKIKILPTNAEPLTYRQEQKLKELKAAVEKVYGKDAKVVIKRQEPKEEDTPP